MDSRLRRLRDAAQDDFLDFAEDYEPVKAFFDGEQKGIFDKALLYLEKYDDSKTYIVDEELEFEQSYTKVLNDNLEPVKESIAESQKRVFEVLNTKEYKEKKQKPYIELFIEIENRADACTNRWTT